MRNIITRAAVVAVAVGWLAAGPGEARAQVPLPTATGQYGSAATRPGQSVTVQAFLAVSTRQGYSFLGDSVEVWANGARIGTISTTRQTIVQGGVIGVGSLTWTVPRTAAPNSRIGLTFVYRGRGSYAASSGTGYVTVNR